MVIRMGHEQDRDKQSRDKDHGQDHRAWTVLEPGPNLEPCPREQELAAEPGPTEPEPGTKTMQNLDSTGTRSKTGTGTQSSTRSSS